jgi:hypothetical protein
MNYGKRSFRRRTFLTPVSSGVDSCVWAEVESSKSGAYRCGTNVIIIADCHRRIQLEFVLARPRDRQRSLAKIDLLIEVLNAFRTALQREAKLIAESDPRTRVRKSKPQQ